MKSNSDDVSKGALLIVDDRPENLQFLSELLNQQGYKVRSVTNGQMTLKTVRVKPPDLILLDIKMPVMDGYEVCQILKADQNTCEIPVIFLSSLGEAFNKVRAFEVGGADYVTKPFQAEEVLVRIENQLTIQRQKALLQKEIRERKQTEEILYQSRALIASVLNSSLDGVAAFQSVRNQQGHIVDFRWIVTNPIAAKIVGQNVESLIGMSLLENLPGMQVEGLFEAYVSVVETGEVFKQELYYRHDSIQAWFQIVAVKLGDGFAITLRDITEQKQLALALQTANQELHRLATLDGLTQMANRRQFDQYLVQEWRCLMRAKQPLSIILCDVDYFKLYNDHYGHQAGDACLKQVAKRISHSVKRPADLTARYGGEEFAVILPDTPLDGARQLAETIRLEVQQLKIVHTASPVSENITISLGVASLVPSQDLSPDHLVAAADVALYQAKNQGRNMACVYQPSSDLAGRIADSGE